MTEGEEKESREKEEGVESSSFLSKEGGGACPDEAAAAPESEGGGEEDAPEDGDAHEAFGPSGVADEEGDRSGGMCESRGGEAGAGTRRNGEPEVGGTEGTEPEGGTQGGREGRPPANGGCSSTAVAGEEGMFSDVTLNFMTGMSVMRNLFASLSDIPEDSGSSSSDLFPSLSLPTTCIDSSPLALPSPVSVTSPLFLPTTYVAPPSASPAAPSAASSTSWSSRVRQLVRKFSVSGGAGLLDNAGRFLNRFVLRKSKSLPGAPVFYSEGGGEEEKGGEVFEAEADSRGGGGGGSSEENEDEAMDHQPGWVRKRVSEIERIMRERALEREYLEDEKTRKDSFKNLRSDDEEGIGVRKESFCQEEEGARKDTVLLEMEKEVFADPEDFPESGHEKLRRGEGSEVVVMEYAREEREGDGGKENELETRGGPREGQGAGYANGGREDHKEGESEAGETEREDSEETLSEDGSEEDTNDEDDDGEPQVELRGQSRSRPASLYRYSSVRPRTIIMGLG